MNNQSLAELLEQGREAEAAAMLMKGVHLKAAVDHRSVEVALQVAKRLYAGNLLSTIWFMNRQHPWLGGQTPIERAEESDEGMAFVLDMLGAIEAGVYI